MCLIRHKLKDCDMMKSFRISGSLTRATKLDEDPSRSNMMPFPGEDAVMIVCGGRPPPKRRCMSNLSLEALTHCGWGHEDTGA
jgi:hypothetical protein